MLAEVSERLVELEIQREGLVGIQRDARDLVAELEAVYGATEGKRPGRKKEHVCPVGKKCSKCLRAERQARWRAKSRG